VTPLLLGVAIGAFVFGALIFVAGYQAGRRSSVASAVDRRLSRELDPGPVGGVNDQSRVDRADRGEATP
jgi:hypothetical protein